MVVLNELEIRSIRPVRTAAGSGSDSRLGSSAARWPVCRPPGSSSSSRAGARGGAGLDDSQSLRARR